MEYGLRRIGKLSGSDANREAEARLISVDQMTILQLLTGLTAMPGLGGVGATT